MEPNADILIDRDDSMLADMSIPLDRQTMTRADGAELYQLIRELETKVAQQDRTIVGLQNELIRAGRYTHEDPQKQVEGIQVLLTKAGEYKGRQRKVRRG